MKIAITAAGPSEESAVDPRFGRAAHFLLFDTETGDFSTHPNDQNLNAAQGAGIQSAQTVERLGASWVLTGHCGPKAFRVLQAAGIQVAIGVAGTVREAAEAFRAGTLSAAGSADVEGHWA